MKNLLARISMSLAFTAGLSFHPVLPAVAEAPTPATAAGLVSPAGLINPDGTVRLDGGFSGSLDLEGWDVRIDSALGPVLTPETGTEAQPLQTAAAGEWDDLGYGNGDLSDLVHSIVAYGGDVILGGTFTDVASDPDIDYIARWDGSSWSAVGDNGSGGSVINNQVSAMLVDGTDLYAGGWFSNLTNDSTYMPTADYVAKFDGTDWSALSSNGAGSGSLNSGVNALAMLGGELYAAGDFTNVNDGGSVLNTADRIAKWDGSNWFALGSNGAGDGSLNGQVLALAVIGSNLYAGGFFFNVNNGGSILGAADYIAMWDGSDWSALSDNGSGDGSVNTTVYALASMGTDLYVGGAFSNVNDGGSVLSAADYLAMWNGSNWSAVSDNGSGNGALVNYVIGLMVNGSDLYVGGYFQDVNNGGTVLPAADYLAKWDGSDFSAIGDNGAGDGSLTDGVVAMLLDGSVLYAGGYMRGVNNGGTFLSNARFGATWDGSDWSAIGGMQGPFDEQVYAMAVSGSDLYVGGQFWDLSDSGTPIPQADNIARWDGSNWHALGDNGYGNGVISWYVYAITVHGSDVYAGGYFSDITDDTNYMPEADYVARFDGTHWHALGSNGAGNGSLGNGVEDIAVIGTNVYVSGQFTDVNNGGTVLNEADKIARWDGSDWHALSSNGSGDGSFDGSDYVYALGTVGSDLYVGGSFNDIMNGATTLTAADNIARWDGANWSAVGGDGSGGSSLNASVFTFAASGTSLYAGGDFYDVNNGGTVLDEADYVAKWDGTDWSALGSNGFGGGSLNSSVLSLATRGPEVYVGGYFTNVNDGGTMLNEADAVAMWDGSNWRALGSDGSGGGSLTAVYPYAYAYTLAATQTQLYVGGYFFDVSNNGVALPHADLIAAYGLAPSSTPSDYDGDLMTDPVKFVPATGYAWWYRSSDTTWDGFHMGGDVGTYVQRSDFDGDGMTDPAKYVSGPQVTWYFGSSDSLWHGFYMGSGSYSLLPGSDFDADGKTDPAKYDTLGSVWRLLSSTSTWAGTFIGTDAAPALPGSDYDGDGMTDPAKYVATGAIWYFGSSDSTWHGEAIGSDGAPVPASDFDGDGMTDMAKVLTASNTLWYHRSSDAAWVGLYLGPGTFTYVPAADFDGDGQTDPAKFDTGSKTLWYFESGSSTWQAVYMGPETYSVVN